MQNQNILFSEAFILLMGKVMVWMFAETSLILNDPLAAKPS